MISTENFVDSLKKQNESFEKLINERTNKIDIHLADWRSKFLKLGQGASALDLEETFGEFLMNVLGNKINNQKKTHRTDLDDLLVSKTFGIRKSGKNIKAANNALFHLLGSAYLPLITNPRKREIVADFLNFRDVSLAALEKLSAMDYVYINTPVELLEVEHTSISSGIIGDSKPLQLNKIKKLITKKDFTAKIIFRIKYTNKYKQPRAPLLNNMFKHNAIILLVDNTSRHLIGSLDLALFSSAEDAPSVLRTRAGSLLHAYKSFFDQDHSLNETFVSFDLATQTDTRALTVYKEESGVFKSFDISSPSIGTLTPIEAVVINWDEIINDPDIKCKLESYRKTCDLIARSWKYMQNKYSYQILSNGLF